MYGPNVGGTVGGIPDWIISVETDDHLAFSWYSSGFKQQKATTFGAISTGTWYLVVGWHIDTDPSFGSANIQVNNGTVDTNLEASYFGGADTGQPFRCGRWGHSSGRYWDGRLNQVAFWDRVLTSDERTELWNSGNGIGYPGE